MPHPKPKKQTSSEKALTISEDLCSGAMASATNLGNWDYLVIGGGAAGMSFMDTVLCEQKDATVVMLDHHSAPGGHWNDAYPFVHLHQPSCVYGVQSEVLEGSWAGHILRGKSPVAHRASKAEILAYYKKVVAKWEKSNRLKFFGSCTYDYSRRQEYFADGDTHCFAALDGSQRYQVKVNVKIVTAFLGENQVPSKCPLEFPISREIKVITPNALYDDYVEAGGGRTGCCGGPKKPAGGSWRGKKFIVLGAGKTGMDAVVFMQRDMGVPATDITWVISRDVWMVDRAKADPRTFATALVKNSGAYDKSVDELEAQNYLIRLHKDFRPNQMRSPLVDPKELACMRAVTQQVRRGRVTSITYKEETISVAFADEKDPLNFAGPGVSDQYIFVHCASPGPYGKKSWYGLFESEKQLNLALLDLPPVTCSMAMLAALESARRQGSLDLNFGQKLLAANDVVGGSELDVLNLIKWYAPMVGDETLPLRNTALFLALLGVDPKQSLKWINSNRLWTAPPRKKRMYYEVIADMVEKKDAIGYPADVKNILPLLAEKLKSIEGARA